MPATVHKILVHSAEVVAIVPIGQLLEEAQEARNKDCRRFQKHNTRKLSRVATIRDLPSMLIITSDPLINSIREVPKKKTTKICSEVLKLIISPTITGPSQLLPRQNPIPQIEVSDLSDSSNDSEDED